MISFMPKVAGDDQSKPSKLPQTTVQKETSSFYDPQAHALSVFYQLK